MTITCTTLDAAAAVLATLIDARLIHGQDYLTALAVPLTAPVTFTIVIDLPAYLLSQIRDIPDAIIS